MKKGGKKKKNARRSFQKYNAFEIKFFSLNCFALLRQFSLSGSDCSMRTTLLKKGAHDCMPLLG
jgi:hypothetical protein